MANPRKTYVYVIAWHKAGPCKIGIAKDSAVRLVALQPGCPYPLRLHYQVALATERAAHVLAQAVLERLADVRMQGDWLGTSAANVYAEARKLGENMGYGDASPAPSAVARDARVMNAVEVFEVLTSERIKLGPNVRNRWLDTRNRRVRERFGK